MAKIEQDWDGLQTKDAKVIKMCQGYSPVMKVDPPQGLQGVERRNPQSSTTGQNADSSELVL